MNITPTIVPVPWIVPSIVNCATYCEYGKLLVVNKQDLAPGQADRFTQAMVDVCGLIRSRIQSVPGFVVSATANSIPPELVPEAVQLIMVAMQAAYPALGLTKDQVELFSQAQKRINAIGSKGDMYRPTMPPDPMSASVQGFPPANVVRRTRRAITARSMSGISVGVGPGDYDSVPGLMDG